MCVPTKCQKFNLLFGERCVVMQQLFHAHASVSCPDLISLPVRACASVCLPDCSTAIRPALRVRKCYASCARRPVGLRTAFSGARRTHVAFEICARGISATARQCGCALLLLTSVPPVSGKRSRSPSGRTDYRPGLM